MDPLIGLFGHKSSNCSSGHLEGNCEFDDDTGGLMVDNSSDSSNSINYLPPECAEGNIEYKLKLINPSQSRFEHLVTQMKWRLREGHGEAIYEIGVEDKGLLVGLTEEEADSSLRTLYLMAEKLGATVTILREKIVSPATSSTKRKVMEVLIRRVPDDQGSIELRVAVLGNVEAGKSTLLGVLTQGELDNGRGSARLNLFRHRHEIQSGHTSSISREILGFDSRGCPVTYNVCRTPEEIYESSSKLITFIDLAGHQKYLRTTIFGLMGHSPHIAMLVVSAVAGLAGTTLEHLGLALALDVPIVIVVNKVDLSTSETTKDTLNKLESLLKSPACKKLPIIINCKDDAITAASSMASNITPIFKVSCLNGTGLDLLYTFLNVFSPCLSNKDVDKLIQKDAEFQVDETFHVTEVGTVVGGLLTSGILKEGNWIQIGPNIEGNFVKAQIQSIHRYKVPCRVVRAGESATLALANKEPESLEQLRKGMVIVSLTREPHLENSICLYFQARMHVLYHATMISSGYQATVHIGNICQTAVVIAIMGKRGITTNETASIMLKFLRQPEYVHPGCRVLFREGQSKCIGQVIQIFPISEPQNWLEAM
ncbi:GTP-binding protein 2 [Tetranychus urticae]|uniref:Tr-type G domain-containing protein n=1 Tax=Tetranychus urticae TaxID=32264 RepID=T1K059_TETUR|nr:GTP-binding protein 2 [Tetranychus urticae]